MDTKIGIMPFPKAQEYGSLYTRRPYFLETMQYYNWPDYRVLLNINHEVENLFEINDEKYRQQLLQVPIDDIKPRIIAIENEELHYPGRGSIITYCKQLFIATQVFENYKVVNGGFTLQLYEWYWEQTKDEEFFRYCIPDTMKSSLAAGRRYFEINQIQYELVFMAGLPTEFWNLHFYLRNSNEVFPLVRMINYVSKYIKKKCVCFECGIYDPLLLNEVVSVVKLTNMKICILYSGEGVFGTIPPEALPISREQFQSIV